MGEPVFVTCYSGTGGDGGNLERHLVCVDAKTGKEVTKKRIGGQFYASVVLINDKLYALSRFDGTYVLEATPELTQLAHNRLSDKSDFSASPAVSDGQLILRSDKNLYCIEAE